MKYQLAKEQEQSKNLKYRLDKLVIEFRSRSAVNPRPSVVNALVCTKKLENSSLEIQVIDITPKLVVIDKGQMHGLTYGMFFAIYQKGSNQCLEVCVVDRVETSASWLLHSGTNLPRQITASDLLVQLISPPDIEDSEREIAEILLIAEGAISV